MGNTIHFQQLCQVRLCLFFISHSNFIIIIIHSFEIEITHIFENCIM